MYIRPVDFAKLAVAIIPLLTLAQAPDTTWTRIYGGGRNDRGCSIQNTLDGGYIIAGYTASFGPGDYDVWLLKTNGNGDTLWTKTYGGQYNDWGLSVQQTSDSGYIVAGASEVWGGDTDVLLLKTDINGDTLWTRTYGVMDQCWVNSVQQTSDGSYVMAGHTGSTTFETSDVLVTAANESGYFAWMKVMGGTGNDDAYAIRQTEDNGYIIAGYTTYPRSDSQDVYLVKLDRYGNHVWSKRYGAYGQQQARSLHVTPDNGYVMAGLDRQNNFSIYLMKTDSAGGNVWTNRYLPLPGGAIGTSVQSTCDSGFIIAGYTHPLEFAYGDIYLVKTNANGDSIWARRYGGPPGDRALSIQATRYGNYVTTGYIQPIGYSSDLCIMKTNPENYLTLTMPNGGEAWAGGTTIVISWWCRNALLGECFQLLFSTDGGSSYLDTIAANIPPDSTAWAWTLPHIIDSTCRLKIQILDSSDVIIATDASDADFAILESTPPLPFSLIAPADSLILPIARPTFLWHASFDSASGLQDYGVYLNDTLLHMGCDTTWQVDHDLLDGWYNWHILAYDSVGNSRQSNEIWVVLIDTTRPPVVNLISPNDYSYLGDSAVDFTWHEAYDNLSGVDHYKLQCAPDTFFLQGVIETTLVDTTFAITLVDTVYYWRVKAFDIAGNEGEFSAIWRFGIGSDSTAPITPTLLSPINGIILNDTSVIFEWTVVNDLMSNKKRKSREDIERLTIPAEDMAAPVRYIIQIDTLVIFATPVIVDTIDFASTVAYLYDNIPFYWRVKAYDWAGNQGAYTSPDSFGVTFPPVIDSTTVWPDTSYAGPFEILTKVTDNLRTVDTVILIYRRIEDPDWISSQMALLGMTHWYLDSIPVVDTLTDTVRYYIEAVDNVGNTTTDPAGAPANCYSFLANYHPGICDTGITSEFSSFRLKANPTTNVALFFLCMPREAVITLEIYDVCGRLIDRVVSGRVSAGTHDILWTAKANAAGIYFYAFESPWQRQVGKFIIIK